MAELRWIDSPPQEVYYHTAWCAVCRGMFILVSGKSTLSVERWLLEHEHSRPTLRLERDKTYAHTSRGVYLRCPVRFVAHPIMAPTDNYYFLDFASAQKFINNGFKFFKEEK